MLNCIWYLGQQYGYVLKSCCLNDSPAWKIRWDKENMCLFHNMRIGMSISSSNDLPWVEMLIASITLSGRTSHCMILQSRMHVLLSICALFPIYCQSSVVTAGHCGDCDARPRQLVIPSLAAGQIQGVACLSPNVSVAEGNGGVDGNERSFSKRTQWPSYP